MRTALHQLHNRYAALAAEDSRVFTDDKRRSVAYYLLDVNDRQDPAARDRPAVWVRTVRLLHAFTVREGRLPRENNRLGRQEITDEERRLAEWVRYQRRPATRASHCDYQRRRLEAVPGFRWDPIGQAWMTNLEAYRVFTAARRRAPSSRSLDAGERRLAVWAAKQRFHRKRGRLAAGRVAALNRLPMWTWGSQTAVANGQPQQPGDGTNR